MGVGVGVAIEVELTRRERTGVETAGELGVREGLERERPPRRGGSACSGAPIIDAASASLASAAAVRARVTGRLASFTARSAVSCIAVELRAPELVHGELGHKRDRLTASRDREAVEGAHKADAGLLLSTEEALHWSKAAVSRLGARASPGRDLESLEQGAVAVGVVAVAVSAPARATEELDTLSAPQSREKRRAAPNQRAALAGASRTAASPASRRTPNAPTSPSRAERSSGGRAPRPWPRALRAHRRPLVRTRPPAAGRRLVDRTPDERMPEAEAPRHVGLANEIQSQQLVDRVHRDVSDVPRPPPPAPARRDRRTAAPSRTTRAWSDSGPAPRSATRPRRRNVDAAEDISDTGGVVSGRSNERASCSR